MFAALVKRLFSVKKKNQANYFYYEETKNVKQEQQQDSIEQLQSELSNPQELVIDEHHHQIAFYDFLFGQSPPVTTHDELSLFVANKIEQLLASPKSILASLPVLPASLTQVLQQLNNEDFDTDELILLIQQEPVVAAKVIELANSSFYNHSDKEITDLKSAFMLLGANGLIEGVINGFVSKLTPNSPIYFQQYGNKIWQHSISTGKIAKLLIKSSPYAQESAQGYLIGLICNLGDMIIYQLLMDAFSYVHPDCQPNSFAFKELMRRNSKNLAFLMAKYWAFPTSILEVLAYQTKITKSELLPVLYKRDPVACYVYEANLISELLMRLENNEIDNDYLDKAQNILLYSDEAKHYLTLQQTSKKLATC